MLNFYNKENAKHDSIDIYFTPEYGFACEISDEAEWECCCYKDLIYVYLKRKIKLGDEIYFDLITPYGYSGFYYKFKETYLDFLILFRDEAKKKKYITEVVRQNPYIDCDLNNYDFITSRKSYGVDLSKYNNINEYFKDTSKNNKKMIMKAINNELIFKLEDFDCINNFIEIYNETMKNLKAKSYYFFSKNYYEKLKKINNNIKFANVYKNNTLIASCMIFFYKKYINYHIGGSKIDYRIYGCNNFLHYNVINYGIQNKYKIYHLGAGIKEEDSLSYFKKSISNINFNYTIYKNIINENIYNELIKELDKSQNFFPLYRL